MRLALRRGGFALSADVLVRGIGVCGGANALVPFSSPVLLAPFSHALVIVGSETGNGVNVLGVGG